jgi:hypothetical protein
MNKNIHVYSGHYGDVVYSYLCTVDLTKGTVDDYMEWMEKYHPKKYFHAWLTNGDEMDYIFEIYTPIQKDNKDWVRKVEHPKSWKHLPITISDKKLKKWVNATKKFIVEDNNGRGL